MKKATKAGDLDKAIFLRTKIEEFKKGTTPNDKAKENKVEQPWYIGQYQNPRTKFTFEIKPNGLAIPSSPGITGKWKIMLNKELMITWSNKNWLKFDSQKKAKKIVATTILRGKEINVHYEKMK